MAKLGSVLGTEESLHALYVTFLSINIKNKTALNICVHHTVCIDLN